MLKLVGDITFTDSFFDTGFGVGSMIEKGLNPFSKLKRLPEDIWIGNCECVISECSNKKGIYRNQFRINPKSLERLKHLDIYSVANNHSMQHGSRAFADTIKNLESFGSRHVGSNNRKAINIRHQGRNIYLAAFSQRDEKYSNQPDYWYCPEYADIKKTLDASQDADYKIAYIHWGIEFVNRPYSDQKQFARWLIDIGFDLIVGLHPHVLQGFEVYRGKYIFYSAGNFVFNMPWEPAKYSVIINIDFSDKEPLISHDYVYIGNNYCPGIINENEVPLVYRCDYLGKKLLLEQDNEQYYSIARKRLSEYRRNNHKTIIKSIHKFKVKDLGYIVNDFVLRRFFNKFVNLT